MKSIFTLCFLPAFATAQMLSASSANTSTQIQNPPNYGTMLPPAAGQTYVDPVFGTTISRITDAVHTADAESSGNLTWIENEYSTVAAYNGNNSHFILVHESYFGLYAGNGSFLRNLPFEISASSEPRWSRKDNVTLYYHVANMLKSYNVSTGQISVVHTFTQYASISGRGEADLSQDGDHMVLVGDNRYIFVYQLSTKHQYHVFETGGRAFDSVMITPQNNVIVSWDVSGNVRYTGQELFNFNMGFLRQVGHSDGHKDTTVDSNGDEVVVWTNSNDPQPIACQNGIVKIKLRDASQLCLQPLDWSLAVHITAPDRNSTAFFDTYAPSDPQPGTSGWVPYTNELLQIGLSGTTAPYRIAHHRSQPRDSYLYQPKMTVSRDGTKLLYASNFDLQQLESYPTDYADAYMIAVNWSAQTPASAAPVVNTSANVVRFEQNNPAVTLAGSWITKGGASDSGGSSAAADTAGASAQFTFSGKAVTWIGSGDATSGIAEIYLDGKLISIIDTFSPTPIQQQVQFTMHNLSNGTHTLQIIATGEKNPSGAGSWVSVDAFDVTN